MNNSSLIDLKAELLRKQEQFKKEKLSGTTTKKSKHKEKKTELWSRSNAGVLERAQKDMEAKKEEEDAMTKSRKMLETKARLYESMTSGNTIPDEDGSKRFLVDFERKTVDKIVEEREKERGNSQKKSEPTEPSEADKEDIKKLFLKEKIPEPTNPEEEWVDFMDSLGRSRRCMRKDLPELMEMDKNLSRNRNDANKTKQTSLPGNKLADGMPDLMSSDMYREKLREQWEKEEREAMEGPAGPVHYANVQHNEIRTHGAGYYQFDKKEETREEQMKELQSLREQTKEKRAAHQRLKDKRKAMLASRLAKVRQKKLIKEGKDPMEMLDPDKSDDSDEDLIGPKLTEKEPEPEILTRDDSWRSKAPVRDWDKGKEGLDEFLKGHAVHSEESWLDKLRSERHDEFAPPSIYQTSGSASRSNKPQVKSQNKKWTESASRPNQVPGPNPEFAPPAMYQNDTRHQPWNKAPSQVNSTRIKSQDESTSKPGNLGDVIGQRLSDIRAQSEAKQTVTRQKEQETNQNIPDSLRDIPLPPTVQPVETDVHENHPSVTSSANTAGIHERLQMIAQGSTSIEGQQAQHSLNAGYHQTAGPYQQDLQQNECNPGVSVSSSMPSQFINLESEPSTSQGLVDQGPPPKRPPPQAQPFQAQSVSAAPQPAHYSSAPMKPQPKKPRYERVNLHEIPLTLPVPPTADNVPEYPSQEEVFGPQKSAAPKSDEQAAKQWQRQFQYKDSGKANLTPAGIPFPSPYIQNKDKTAEDEPGVEYDPSKPPPSAS